MAKKTFKDSLNPAMNFISKESIEKADGDQTVPETTKSGKPPKGYKLNPLYVETKSRRLQLLVQPSLHEKLKTKANENGMSLNELVNTILQDFLDASEEE